MNGRIKDSTLEELLAGVETQEDIFGKNGILQQLSKTMLERVLQTELTHHLGHEPGNPINNVHGNKRNGVSNKNIKTEFGTVNLEIPRDREGSFNPIIIPKGQNRVKGLDSRIIYLYSRGMTTREIQNHLLELYGVEISPTLISSITDAVIDEIKAWQSRPLDAIYPIVYLDCLYLKIGTV